MASKDSSSFLLFNAKQIPVNLFDQLLGDLFSDQNNACENLSSVESDDIDCELWHNAVDPPVSCLAIRAMTKPKDTDEYFWEQKQRESECKKYFDDIEGKLTYGIHNKDPREVDKYEEMKKAVEDFFANKETAKSQTIIVTFLGHGSFDGEDNATLCFVGNENYRVKKAFDDIRELYSDTGLSATLRIVFAQCHSYKHNINNATARAEYADVCGDYFMFLTNDGHEKTTSKVGFDHIRHDSAKEVNFREVNHRVKSDHPYVKECIDKLLLQTTATQFKRRHLFNWLVKQICPGPTTDDINSEVSAMRRRIKSYVHINILPANNAAKLVAKQSIYFDGFPCTKLDIHTFKDFQDKIGAHFDNIAVHHPIVLISGNVNEKDEMVFQGSPLSRENLLSEIKAKFNEKKHESVAEDAVRVAFFCESKFAEDTVDSGARGEAAQNQTLVYTNAEAKFRAFNIDLEAAMDKILQLC